MDKEVYEVFFKEHLIGILTIDVVHDKYCYEVNVEGVKAVQDTVSVLTKHMYDTPGNMGPLPFFARIVDHMKWWHKEEAVYPDIDLMVRCRRLGK